MRLAVVMILLFSASHIAPSPSSRGVVVWNVGQGQWVSFVEPERCYHFDVGGEFFPWKQIQAACGRRENWISLSHWDWDHIGAIKHPRFGRALKQVCLFHRPLGKSSARKQALLNPLPACAKNPGALFHWYPQNHRHSNDASHVFQYKRVLLPGDSSAIQEKIWSSLPWLPSTRILVLGHHGSKTSTSESLLARLSQTKMAVSSARWKRYSHPHPQTQMRLRKYRIPLLRTEDWGNIWFL